VTLVALSASYGTGGSRIAPALAAELGVPFLDRAIPLQVSEQLDVPYDQAAAFDEHAPSWLERVLSGFRGTDSVVPEAVPAATLVPEDFHEATEQALLRQAQTGEGVLLGRGAVLVLREDPRVLRVRLDAPPERRIRLAMELQELDEETARHGQRHADATHAAYARQFYGTRLDDTSLYHVLLDPTRLGVETCVELLAAAARAFAAA
jgi:cytidylate kinase